MLHFLIYDVLGTPAILVGLFSLIGLLLQKKGISDVISGTLKTIMGFVILTAGAGIIAYTLTIFSQLFEHSFHIQGVVPNTDAMAALAQKNYGTETATIMVLGMLINIALARLTPLKYIFLTGHHTLYMAAMLAVILSVGGLSGGWVVAIGAVILGAMMVISPAILQPFTVKLPIPTIWLSAILALLVICFPRWWAKSSGKVAPRLKKLKCLSHSIFFATRRWPSLSL